MNFVKTHKRKLLISFWALLLILNPLIIGSKYPGYSQTREFVSLLNAVGSPTRVFATASSFVLGLYLVVFALKCKPFKNKYVSYAAIAFGLSYLLNVVLPCAKTCGYEPIWLGLAHDAVSISEVMAMYFVFMALRAKQSSLSNVAIKLGAIYIVFIAAAAVLGIGSEISGVEYYDGLWQRIGEWSLALFFVLSTLSDKSD
jgi:hypothetical protein